jgi:LysM repeat protein
VSAPVQAPPAGGGKPGAKLAAAAGGKRNLLLAAAGGVALVAFIASRSGGGSSSGDATAIQPYDSTVSDQYNDLQGQLEDIQRQIDNGTVTPGTPPSTTPTTPASPKPPPVVSKPKPVVKPLPQPIKKPPVAVTHKTVTIKRGDTLSGIAKKAGISMATLKKLNPVFWTNSKYHNGNTIFAGGHVKVS